MQGKTMQSVSYNREVREGNSLKVSIGFSHKIIINDLAENSFSGVIRAEARVQWVE